MRVGLSFSRCVLDIAEGRVDINDVLVIIARTDFDPNDDKQWADIWRGYGGSPDMSLVNEFSPSAPQWAGQTICPVHWAGQTDNDRFRSVSIELWESGKLHQPRKFGARTNRSRSEIWLETVLPDSELESRPAVKEAWDQFQMLAGLTNTNLDKDYQ